MRPDRRDQAESPRLHGGEIAVPAVAGQVEVVAAEAEGVRAAGAVGDTTYGAQSSAACSHHGAVPLKPLWAEARAPRIEPSGANATIRPSQSSW